MTSGTGRTAVALMAIMVIGGFATPALAAPARARLDGRGHYTHRGSHGEVDVNVCSADHQPGFAQCAAHIRTDPLADDAQGGSHDVLGNLGAYDPAYLQAAYDAPSSTHGGGQTVAVLDAYDAPNVAADLAVYRTRFNLPPCTVANGCFRKVDQNGGTAYPAPHASWAQETTLDVQMVSALCPNCDILVVEANNNWLANLGTAVDTAVSLGADVVSNSYGGNEFPSETSADHYFDHPGVPIVASSGDHGFGVSYPAASPHVVAVGGTNLHQATATGTRNATETVWSGAGSGCSAYEPKPAWQTDSGCPRRSVADISAVADPSTGVWVYVEGAWVVFGGTSVAAPIVGALYALAGNAPSAVNMSSLPYAMPAAFNDVVSGSNGACGGTYLCTGGAGYDGPTGLGTPNSPVGLALTGSIAPPDPDFGVTASVLRASMRPGATAHTPVTVTPTGGFSGNVHLSVAANPASGLTATLEDSSLAVGAGAAASTLRFTARTGGKYVVTVTASQGALVHKARLTVYVNDFSMAVTKAAATVVRGNRVRFTLELTPRGAFKAFVNLSVSGLSARDAVIYTHNPAEAKSTQVITITTSAKDPRGLRSLRFTGISGALRHSVTVALFVR